MKARILLTGIILIFLSAHAMPQRQARTRSSFLSAGYLQVKESQNFGLVFGGPSLNYGVRATGCRDNFTSIYEFDLGLATPVTREIVGVNFHIKPVDLFLGVKLDLFDMELLFGPAFRLDYNVQFYPDLQSGFDYWLTELSTGLSAIVSIPLGESKVEIKARNSVTGLVCRNEVYLDPYHFDLDVLSVLRDVHQNGRTFRPSSYNSTNLEIRFTSKPDSRFSIALCADYTNYRNNPEIGMLNQSVRLYFNPKY